MDFRIKVTDGKSKWWETYKNIQNIDDAKAMAKVFIDNFNRTLRPYEKPRKLLRVEIIGKRNININHEWIKKTNGMSVPFRDGIVDLYYCRRCGITGKRYGLNNEIAIDSKYKKKEYRKCKKDIQKKE